MSICNCGRKVGASGKQCRRCAALNDLGLKAGASEESVKSAYRHQVKTWHPDRREKDKTAQVVANEKTKRIIAAYRYLTSPSKKGDAPTTRNSSTTPEASRPQPSSTTYKSSKGQAARTTNPPQPTGDKEQQPRTSSTFRTMHSGRTRQTIPNYPQKDFTQWKSAFDKVLVNGTKAAAGLKKWVRSEAEDRAFLIEFAVSTGSAFGPEPDLKHYAKPEDARGYVLKRLWNGSAPNVIERTGATNKDRLFLKRMENLKESVDSFAEGIEQRGRWLMTQDRVFPIRLHDVLEHCIHLSTSIATASALVKRKYIQPLTIADCCTELVWELEENHGLSQAECHALIKVALLAHGCAPEQVTPFGAGSVERGTIRAKKNAFEKGVRDSYDVISEVFQNPKQSAPDSPRKKSRL